MVGRSESPAHVLNGNRIAAPRVIPALQLFELFLIRRADQNHGRPARARRQVQIRRKLHAVAHRHGGSRPHLDQILRLRYRPVVGPCLAQLLIALAHEDRILFRYATGQSRESRSQINPAVVVGQHVVFMRGRRVNPSRELQVLSPDETLHRFAALHAQIGVAHDFEIQYQHRQRLALLSGLVEAPQRQAHQRRSPGLEGERILRRAAAVKAQVGRRELVGIAGPLPHALAGHGACPAPLRVGSNRHRLIGRLPAQRQGRRARERAIGLPLKRQPPDPIFVGIHEESALVGEPCQRGRLPPRSGACQKSRRNQSKSHVSS